MHNQSNKVCRKKKIYMDKQSCSCFSLAKLKKLRKENEINFSGKINYIQYMYKIYYQLVN